MGFSHGGYLSGKAMTASGEGYRFPGCAAEFQQLKVCVDFLNRGMIRKTAAEMFPFFPAFLRFPKQNPRLFPVAFRGTLGGLVELSFNGLMDFHHGEGGQKTAQKQQ